MAEKLEEEVTTSPSIDLRDPSNCLSIATAKPGQEIRVLVRSADNATAAAHGSRGYSQWCLEGMARNRPTIYATAIA
jgi:hypothetical protein